MDWQPIETAPKDGTPILTWSDLGCVVGEWLYSFRDRIEQWRAQLKTDTYNGIPLEEVGSWLASIGGEYVDDGTYDHGCVELRPTYWRPLPPPPSERD